METTDYFTLARSLHVIGVVLWIGGVAFVTTILVPSLNDIANGDNKIHIFEQLEMRFAFQARITTLITGLTGLYMLYVLDAWDRYQHIEFWWMHLMTFIWAIFTLVLFVLEPLVLHRWFIKQAQQDSKIAFMWLHRMHKILLALSLMAVFAAVAGTHGWRF